MHNFIELHKDIANGEPSPFLVNASCVTMVEKRPDGTAIVWVVEYSQGIRVTETYDEVCGALMCAAWERRMPGTKLAQR